MSDFFCPLPWIHQFIQPTGIKVCCSNTKQLSVSPKEFEQSDLVKSIRDTILSGSAPQSCEACVHNEANNLTSTRTDALRDWPGYTAKSVPARVEYLDLRYDNLCNFSCRTCEPNFSSSIQRELESHPELQQFYSATTESLDYSNISDRIHNYYTTLKKLNLTGGEPLLNKTHLNILQQLIDHKRSDVQLLITTNVSVINPKMLNLIKKFNDVHWTLSIDAVEKSAEYIRHGSIWSSIEKNVNDILRLKHSVSINATLSAYSVLTLSKLVEWFSILKEKYADQPFEIMFNTVRYPLHLQPQVLPSDLRLRAITELDRSIDILATIKSNPIHQLDNLRNLRSNLYDTLDDQALVKKFKEFTITLDKIRNQDFNQTFQVEM
jgi:sulfatase maturation enzyme AslB (radical SAM superfamily)